MPTVDRLFVIWSEPTAGRRRVIGHLARSGGEFRFWYEDDLSNAKACGFDLLPAFPEYRTSSNPYVARYLFALFAERIPELTRRDATDLMDEWGVDHPDDQFEVLAKSGGIRATDRLELAEYREPDDSLVRPLEFRIAGRRFVSEPALLAVGDQISLRREPENEADPHAVVLERNGRHAGYVPHQYARLLSGLLERAVILEAHVVRELIVPDDVGKWVVRAVRRTQ